MFPPLCGLGVKRYGGGEKESCFKLFSALTDGLFLDNIWRSFLVEEAWEWGFGVWNDRPFNIPVRRVKSKQFKT